MSIFIFFMSNNKIYSFLAINIQLNYTTFILYTLIRKIKKKKNIRKNLDYLLFFAIYLNISLLFKILYFYTTI